MDIDIEAKKREVIPRFRDFKTTLALGELNSPKQFSDKDTGIEGDIDGQIADWKKNQTLAFATDLVGAGFVLGKKEGIEDAVNFILSEESSATNLQRRIARQAQYPEYCPQLSVTEDVTINSSDEIISQSRERVKVYRAQLRKSIRNPVKLVELSREFAILGSIDNALRTMHIAVALAPANRFVLRSAARLYVHAGQIEQAHHVLKRAPSLHSDTWLLAAEIAVSSMLDRTSGSVRTGMNKIENTDYSPFEVSELTSALATLEMNNANSKLARKLFKRALRSPTDNSIAQAEWASRSMGNFSVEAEKYDAPRNYEALAWSHFKHRALENAISQGKNWIRDQPFADSPIRFTGFVATILEDYNLSESVYSFGLKANPDNVGLRNDLVFTLASNNEPKLAEDELERIDRSSLTEQERIVILANEGLIRFRKGKIDQGRSLYIQAIDLAKINKEPNYAFRALMFLAREEINARTTLAIPTLETLEREAKNVPPTIEIEMMLNRLKSTVQSRPDEFGRTIKFKEGANKK